VRSLFPQEGDVDPLDVYGRLGLLPNGRPAVRLNMIASVDGAAYLDDRSGALGGPADKALFATLRSLADVVLVGAATVRAERYGPARLDDAARDRRIAWGIAPVPPIAVVSRRCRLDWEAPFFRDAVERPLVLTAASADEADRRRAAQVADVVVAGDTGVDLAAAVAVLGERGHSNVLAEGGPAIAAQLAGSEVLDEVCLTVSPLLTAGGARRIFDGEALAPPARLVLAGALEADGYLFLRYRLV
jgi:riboflavin biosynthesis pyrimidine reductase